MSGCCKIHICFENYENVTRSADFLTSLLTACGWCITRQRVIDHASSTVGRWKPHGYQTKVKVIHHDMDSNVKSGQLRAPLKTASLHPCLLSDPVKEGRSWNQSTGRKVKSHREQGKPRDPVKSVKTQHRDLENHRVSADLRGLYEMFRAVTWCPHDAAL